MYKQQSVALLYCVQKGDKKTFFLILEMTTLFRNWRCKMQNCFSFWDGAHSFILTALSARVPGCQKLQMTA